MLLGTFVARSGSAQVQVDLVPGLNLFSFPGAIPADADTCFELLTFLGGAGAVERIARIAPAQVAEACALEGGPPSGSDFEIREGDGYLVHMAAPATVQAAPGTCPELELVAGVNLVGIPVPRPDLSCFGVLDSLGLPVVAAIERLDSRTGAFEDCSADLGGALPAGRDFAIVPGEGYLLHLREPLFDPLATLCAAAPGPFSAAAASPSVERAEAPSSEASSDSVATKRTVDETKRDSGRVAGGHEIVLRADLPLNPTAVPGVGERGLRITLVRGGTLPPPLPAGLAPGFWIEVLPLGLPFSEPLALKVPNLDRLPASTEVWIWSRHEPGGDFEIAGEGRVSGDGGWIEMSSGGIRGPGWHFFLPPAKTPRAASSGGGRP